MAKHRRSSMAKGKRNAAVASAVAIGASLLAQQAQAAEVVIPNTDFKVEVPGLENVPGIKSVPGVSGVIPSISSQGSTIDFAKLSSEPQATPQPEQNIGEKVVEAARSKIGAPYVWGATGPNAFDCSGLTSWAYRQVGKQIPRTSQAQAASGTRVSRDQLQPGDVVAFYSGASHVGIYTGHGTVIHAIKEGTPLSETKLDYMPFHSAVRF